MKTVNRKVIVVVGPTASGKTRLAVRLARRFGGEIVSADSRQVYRGMDVGTGKDLGEYGVVKQIANRKSQMVAVPYHLIDIISPKRQFTVADYQRKAYLVIDDILARSKLPIVCGGSGLYVAAVIEGYVLPGQQIANRKSQMVRKKLDTLSLKQLVIRLKKIDPATYRVIDKKNRRRVQRALEIYYQTGRPKSVQLKRQPPPYHFLILGLSVPKAVLNRRIKARLRQRLGQGMVTEVSRLHRQNVSWKKLESFGLEYRWVAKYLQKKISREQMVAGLERDIQHFAKRQLTWFKPNQNIRWITAAGQADQIVKRFIVQR